MATFHENLVHSFTNFKNKYITPIQTALNDKQDKLTNPLTQSDVVDNLNSTSTTTPLSAKQGKVLNNTLTKKLTVDTWWPANNTTTSSNTYDGVYSTNPGNIPSDLLTALNTYYTNMSGYGTIYTVKSASYFTAMYIDVYGNVLVRFTNTGYSDGRLWNRLTDQKILPMFSLIGKKCEVTQVISSYYSHYIPFSDISEGDIVLCKYNDGSILIGFIAKNSNNKLDITRYNWLLSLGVEKQSGTPVPNDAIGFASFAILTNGIRVMESRSADAVAWYCVLGKTLVSDNYLETQMNKHTIDGNSGAIILNDTDFHEIIMPYDGYITIFPRGNASVRLAQNTAGTYMLDTNQQYYFNSMYAKKGTKFYVKTTNAGLGAYFFTELK